MTNGEALVGLAWVQSARHEFEKSTESARKALAVDATNAAAYGLLGDAALELGDYDLAAEHYQKMLDLRPDISAYSRSAHFLFVTGDVRRATWLMDRAIKAGAPYAENTAWCRAQLALMHLATGNLVAAEQIVEQAIARTPSNYHVLFAQGRVRGRARQLRGRHRVISPRRGDRAAARVVVALGQLYLVTDDQKRAEQQWALVETIDALNKANGVTGDVQIVRFLADRDRRLPEALAIAEREFKRRPSVFVARRAGLDVLQERPVRRRATGRGQGAGAAHARRELALPRRDDPRQARRPRDGAAPAGAGAQPESRVRSDRRADRRGDARRARCARTGRAAAVDGADQRRGSVSSM